MVPNGAWQRSSEALALVLELPADAVADIVLDSARFELFGLVDAALAGEPARALRMARSLAAEDAAMPLLVWALVSGLGGYHSIDTSDGLAILRDQDVAVHPDKINPHLEAAELVPLRQGCKLIDLVLRPQLTILQLATYIPALQRQLDKLPESRRAELIECAEILIKYSGYIEREREQAAKLERLEYVFIPESIDYSSIQALSTEARQKLESIRPTTIGQASRIPGISPHDVSVLLVLAGR